VGGIPDVVTDGESGRLVEPDDVDALAAALVELGRDDALRGKLGEAAERRAEAFSSSVASEKLLAVYAALARAKGLV
ncbi:MAG: glycosyltransferase, partial [Candidatus Rokuibacteriota bacterium]